MSLWAGVSDPTLVAQDSKSNSSIGRYVTVLGHPGKTFSKGKNLNMAQRVPGIRLHCAEGNYTAKSKCLMHHTLQLAAVYQCVAISFPH